MSNLQVQSTEVLCSVVVSVAQEKCPDMLPHAREVYLRFKTAIGLFGKCHDNGNVAMYVAMYVYMRYQSCWFLHRKDIAAIMAFYRQTFPTATILPKMHILEDHVIPWMQRWHIGARLMGEQGAESIMHTSTGLKCNIMG